MFGFLNFGSSYNIVMRTAFASLFLFLAACVLQAPFANPKIVRAAEQIPVVPEVPFVLIEQNNVYLYAQDEFLNFYPLTSLPVTYYALAVETYNTVYYKVLYYDLEGFLKKEDVTLVDYEPVTKFAVGSLSITADVTGINLREKPNHTLDNIIAEIKSGQTLTYYGKVVGTSPILSAGDGWYYVKYSDETEATYFGYLYAPYVTAETIPDNSPEKVMVDVIPAPVIESPKNPNAAKFPDLTTAAFIILLCLPVVLVMMILFKKPQDPKKTPRSF